MLHGNQKAEIYCNVLEHCLHPLVNLAVQNHCGVLFQLDNSPIHTALVTRDWLSFNFIRDMDLLARSFNLNSKEILLVEICWNVYRRRGQFHSVSELQPAVLQSSDDVSSQLH